MGIQSMPKIDCTNSQPGMAKQVFFKLSIAMPIGIACCCNRYLLLF